MPRVPSSLPRPRDTLKLLRCPDYTRFIVIGGNEPTEVFSAAGRYAIGGDGYVDPVAFENVFEVVDGIPHITFEPVIRVRGTVNSVHRSI